MARIWMVAVVLLLMVSCGGNGTTTQALDGDVSLFGIAWNNNCAACSFTSNVDVTMMTTLEDMYSGDDFDSDIAVMDTLISLTLGEPSGLQGAAPEALYIYYDDLGDDII